MWRVHKILYYSAKRFLALFGLLETIIHMRRCCSAKRFLEQLSKMIIHKIQLKRERRFLEQFVLLEMINRMK
jgi:hypothetical protein